MGNQGSGIQLPCLNQRKNFLTMTTVYPTCFESQVFSIHLWQGENLRAVIHRHNGDDGIGAGALPGQLKRVRATGNFQNNVCAAVCALFSHHRDHFFRCGGQDLRILCLHKGSTHRIWLTDNDFPGFF